VRHELGNHTVTHPCSRNFPFSRENVLEDYTLERLDGDLVQGPIKAHGGGDQGKVGEGVREVAKSLSGRS
jgi:hypothetical protein